MKLVRTDELFGEFVKKGWESRRYRIGEKWELNAEEIKEVIDSLKPVGEDSIVADGRQESYWEVEHHGGFSPGGNPLYRCLMHLNHERMFTSVSPEQCQRLVEACFLLARTGEVMDMSDDMILDIFWEQISSFIISNEKYYTDACDKKSERQKERWAELKMLRAEKAAMDGTTPPDDDIGDDEDLPFGNNM